MKKLTVLGAVAIVLGIGYTGLWHYNATNLVEDSRNHIDQLDKANQPAISVTSVESTGFPTSMTLELKDINVKAFDMFKAQVDTYFISRGIFTNSYKTKSHGNVTVSITAPNPEDSLELIFKPGTQSTAEVQFRGNQFIQFLMGRMKMSPVLDSEKQWNLLTELRCFDWADTGHELIEKRSGKTFIKHGPSSTKIKLDQIDDHTYDVDLKLSIKDLEYSPELDKRLATWGEAFSPMISAYSGTPTYPIHKFISFSATGKNSTELEATYKGPLSPSNLGQGDIDFDLDISKYQTSNKFQTGNLQLKFAGQLTKDKFIKDATFKLAGTLKTTQDFTDFVTLTFKTMAQDELDKAAEDKVPTEFSMEHWYEFLQYVFILHANRILPDLTKWGEVKYALDFKIDKANKKNQLNEFSLITDKFGIRIKGFADMTKANSRNDSLEITLVNKKEIVERLYAYATELLDISKETTKNDFNIKLDPGLKQHILDLINKVEEKQAEESPDSTIKITMTGDKLTIGTMDSAQVLMTFMALVFSQQ